MASEAEIIITFLFKHSGKSNLSFSESYLTLSMDLNWFTPEDAKEFINSVLKQKLLTKKGDLLAPNFDYDKIVVPVGFYPSKHVFDEKKDTKDTEEKTVLYTIVQRIVEKSTLNEQHVTEKINIIAKEKNLTSEVTALLIGKEYNIKFDDFFEEVENMIFT